MDSLIIPCFGQGKEKTCYEIYVVPCNFLESSVIPPAQLRPKVVVGCLEFGRELCVVGSKVYLFDSNSFPNSAVGSFDLSPFLDDDDFSSSSKEEVVVLKEEMIRRMPPMRHPKQRVKAIPTPGGKILAFSTRIKFSPYYSRNRTVDFELFDPEKEIWEEIPPFCQDLDVGHRSCRPFSIRSFCFFDDSTFVIHTDTEGIFRLTLGSTKSRWDDEFSLGGGLPFYGYSHATVVGGGQLCLGRDVIWDIRNVGKHHRQVCRLLKPSATFGRDIRNVGKHHRQVCRLLKPSATFGSLKSKSMLNVFEDSSSCCYILETAKLDGVHWLTIEKYHLDLVKYLEAKKDLEEKIEDEQPICDCGNPGQLSKEKMKLHIWDMHFPRLGFHHLSSTAFRLDHGSSSPLLEDTVTFLSVAAVG